MKTINLTISTDSNGSFEIEWDASNDFTTPEVLGLLDLAKDHIITNFGPREKGEQK